MDYLALQNIYAKRFPLLEKVACKIKDDLKVKVKKCLRIDNISARAKSIERFTIKAKRVNEDGSLKYDDPINQIQDQIGVKIVTFYLSDVDEIEKIIKDYYTPIEHKKVAPDNIKEFGYEGKHLILFIEDWHIGNGVDEKDIPNYFELQIKTLFQHAWAECEHDLGYKSDKPLNKEDKRNLAFTAAQAWGADKIFNEVFIKIMRNEKGLQ